MTKITHEKLENICRMARLAPSVHNVQPWEFVLGDNSITVRLSKDRSLDAGDPVQRETWVSIGACVETCLVAAAHQGYAGTVGKLANDGVVITFSPSATNEQIASSSIMKRSSDRTVYSKRQIPAEKLGEIEESSKIPGVELKIVTERPIIDLVAKLTGQGMTMAMQSRAFREELSGLINRPMSSKNTGFSYKSLRINALQGFVQPSLAKSSRSVQYHRKQEQARMKSAQALIMTFTPGDTRKDWVAAGRAYQRAGLMAAQLGLSQATSAAVVEATDFHTDIEDRLGTSKRLQTLMRVGYGSRKSTTSPRIATKDLIV